MRLIIRQPAYLCWLGIPCRMLWADRFVVLDTSQYTDRSIDRRNQIKVGEGVANWVTLPVVKPQAGGHRAMRICDALIDYSQYDWREKHWRQIESAYRKAPFWDEVSPVVADFFDRSGWASMSKVAVESMRMIFEMLDVSRETLLASDLGITSKADDALVDICKAVNADQYISGPFGREYIHREKFDAAGIKLWFHEWEHPVYPQIRGNFLPAMSSLDLLFNVGFEEARRIVHESSGRLLAS